MKRYLLRWGVVALATCAPAMAQHTTHPGHDQPKDARPQAGESKAAPPPARGSIFDSYRRFDPQEPLKDWRAANEEVRQAGGHVGLMKEAGRGGATASHGTAHGKEGK